MSSPPSATNATTTTPTPRPTTARPTTRAPTATHAPTRNLTHAPTGTEPPTARDGPLEFVPARPLVSLNAVPRVTGVGQLSLTGAFRWSYPHAYCVNATTNATTPLTNTTQAQNTTGKYRPFDERHPYLANYTSVYASNHTNNTLANCTDMAFTPGGIVVDMAVVVPYVVGIAVPAAILAIALILCCVGSISATCYKGVCTRYEFVTPPKPSRRTGHAPHPRTKLLKPIFALICITCAVTSASVAMGFNVAANSYAHGLAQNVEQLDVYVRRVSAGVAAW